jgi:CubicO group peptidase (beta-lactamase class C family)
LADQTSDDQRFRLSRREALASLAATCAAGFAGSMSGSHAAENPDGPVFSPSGPNAEHYGAAENYPIKDSALGFVPGNPLQPKYRVGAFSHYAELFPTRIVKHAATPWQFKRAPSDITDPFRERVSDYLSRNPVTGLLIAKDDQILFEHYQYGRTDRDLLLSQSMVKSITGLLIGIAIGDGAIKSVDDTAETYVPGLKGTEYGTTPLRALLHMSSGVDFGEERDHGRAWCAGPAPKARSPASRNSTAASRRRGRGSITPASNPTCSASCSITPSTNRHPTISAKKSGSRPARKPMPNG